MRVGQAPGVPHPPGGVPGVREIHHGVPRGWRREGVLRRLRLRGGAAFGSSSFIARPTADGRFALRKIITSPFCSALKPTPPAPRSPPPHPAPLLPAALHAAGRLRFPQGPLGAGHLPPRRAGEGWHRAADQAHRKVQVSGRPARAEGHVRRAARGAQLAAEGDLRQLGEGRRERPREERGGRARAA